jgi:hypothetical protein
VPDAVNCRPVRLGHDATESHAVLFVGDANERTIGPLSAPIIFKMIIPVFYLVGHKLKAQCCRLDGENPSSARMRHWKGHQNGSIEISLFHFFR